MIHQLIVNAFYCIRLKLKSYRVIFLLLLVVNSNLLAKDFSTLYAIDQLTRVQQVYGRNVKAILFEDIYPYLSMKERQTLASISLSTPLVGQSKALFDFSMQVQTGVMRTSALALKFFDDLSIALAWYEVHNLDKTKIIDYIVKLHTEPSFMQRPLKALSVPLDAWQKNSIVDDMAQKNLKSAVLFLLMHEFAHRHFLHQPYAIISNKRSQQQERQADQYALEIMARMHTAPFGMVSWFMFTGALQSGVAKTHPINAERLEAIASYLELQPKLFISLENKQNLSVEDILLVAKNIRIISSGLRP